MFSLAMNKSVEFVQRYWIGLTLALLTAITFLSLWPLQTLPDVPGSDKTHHLIAYAAVAIPTALKMPARWYFYALLFLAWGGAIELLQPYVNRYGEWLDFAANSAGVVVGFSVGRVVLLVTGKEIEKPLSDTR